jgi:AAA+ ATPase superfamily predicted ATPase
MNKESSYQKIINKKLKKESIFSCKLEDILNITDKFTLPYFCEQGEKNQFKKELIILAMNGFKKLNLVEINNDEYIIHWKDLNFKDNRGDLITNFIKRVKDEQINISLKQLNTKKLTDFPNLI